MTCQGKWHELLVPHGKDGKLFYDSTWIAVMDYTDDDIYQEPDYGDIQQQDIYLEADDEISKGQMESLEAGTQYGSVSQSEVQTLKH